MTTAQRVREVLLMGGPVLPPRTAAEILALGDVAIEPLVTMLVDSQLRDPQGPAVGRAPVHAAKLLGQLPCDLVVEPLLMVLAASAPLSLLRAVVEQALGRLGALLVNRFWRGCRRWTAPTGRSYCPCSPTPAFVTTGSWSSSYKRWRSRQPKPRCIWASTVTRPRCPSCRALDARKLSMPEDPRDDYAVFELREAIQLLGGKLAAAQQRKYECARLVRRIAVSGKVGIHGERSGGLDAPCACGSGRLYKNCCLQ